MNKIFLFACLTIGASLPNGLNAQGKKAHEKSLSFDAAARTGKLSNGFTHYIRHNEEPKKKVIMYLVNKVGSFLEDEDQRGLAHFMEHMEFNGTKHFPHNELVDYLQKNGVRFSADINAYTTFDETVYQIPLPTDDPQVVSHVMEIMGDWAQAALLDSNEIDKERGVVLEEKRLGKGASERMQRVYLPVSLNKSSIQNIFPSFWIPYWLISNIRPYSVFTVTGTVPNLQVQIVVDDINVDQMEKSIKAQFSSFSPVCPNQIHVYLI